MRIPEKIRKVSKSIDRDLIGMSVLSFEVVRAVHLPGLRVEAATRAAIQTGAVGLTLPCDRSAHVCMPASKRARQEVCEPSASSLRNRKRDAVYRRCID